VRFAGKDGKNGDPRFFCTASRGTEGVLADELREQGILPVEPGRGGVAFGETLEHAYRACLWSRVASRVLRPLATFEAGDPTALYAGVHAIDWTEHLGPERTLAVDVAGGSVAPAGPGHFVALKTKDAIVDRIRESEGARPSVDKVAPDVRVNVHLRESTVTVSLDLGGRGLHRRGIGRSGAAAPLKENLAAAILRLAGWPAAAARGAPLLDPFCGSGTLLVEAAWIALDVAPGLTRGRLGAAGLRGHDANLWERLLAEASARRDAARAGDVRITGSDMSATAIRNARRNLARAGIADRVAIEVRELAALAAPSGEPGLVVTNPPYGERLGDAGELGPLYELFGDVLRRRFPGWTAWILSGNRALDKRLGLRPRSRTVLHNGPIECRLLEVPVAEVPVAGDRGPGWRRPSADATGFETRLLANRKRHGAWAERERLTCYRLYDSDVPEYNLAVDWYDGLVRVEEYERPRGVPAEAAERHLKDALLVVPRVLGVDPSRVVLRVRRRRVAGEQHPRYGDRDHRHEVREGDLRFLVNLTDYLDTGLFLDDRLLRRYVSEQARGRDVLNLFSYTCTITVAAAAGGARSTTSIDLSNTYLAWGRANLTANGLLDARHRLIRDDAVRWLARGGDGRRYGLIVLAPPTWSRSRGMAGDLDVDRDHPRLLAGAARLLARDGEILFSTSRRGFVLDERASAGLAVEDLTDRMTPPDFERRPRLRVYRLRPRNAPWLRGSNTRAPRSSPRTHRRTSRPGAKPKPETAPRAAR
jgi:23S rRNA (guanine2445-N2)-methyltransferase / 23S rRNA (guanine2069-N7)-methyltransferase